MPSFFVLVAAVVITDVPANQADKAPCPNTTTGPKIKELMKDYVCKCPIGWIRKSKGCYKVIDGIHDHTEGCIACNALHTDSHLPVLIDDEDMDDLNAIRKSEKIDNWIWLDGDDLSDPGKYKVGSYLNQACEPPYQEGWGCNEPDNGNSVEDCLGISSWVNYKMADGNCRVRLPVICQIPFLNACKPDEIITSLCGSSVPARPPAQPARPPCGGVPAPPRGQPAGQPSGGVPAPPPGQPAGQPSGGVPAPPPGQPAGQPSGGAPAKPAKQPAGQPSVPAQPAGQPAGQPSGGLTSTRKPLWTTRKPFVDTRTEQ